NDSHKDIAIKALEAGKHVICEKPVTLNTNEYAEIIEVAEKTNRIFMVHQNRRWDEDYRIIKNLYDNRRIGEIVPIETRVDGAHGIPGAWRHLKENGGAMLLDWVVPILEPILDMIDSPLRSVSAY